MTVTKVMRVEIVTVDGNERKSDCGWLSWSGEGGVWERVQWRHERWEPRNGDPLREQKTLHIISHIISHYI